MTDRKLNGLELELENQVCDLVSARKYQSFLEQLFARSKGECVSVSGLCDEWPEVAALLHRLGDELFVSWLDYPQTSSGYAVIVFFQENLWSKVAVVNRKLVASTGKKNRPAKARR